MQVFAYDANTGNVAWKYEEDCLPGSRGPGLVYGSWMPLKFKNEDCLVVHGNRQWKVRVTGRWKASLELGMHWPRLIPRLGVWRA